MIIKDLFTFHFQSIQASTERFLRTAVLRFNRVLIITILPRFIPINIFDERCQSSPNSQKCDLCCHAYFYSTGILTCFPFWSFDLRITLGSTYPWLIYIVKEPLPFRWQRFSLCSDLTTTRILIPIESTNPLGNASTPTGRLPTTIITDVYSIGNWLSPVHFRRSHPWRVSCYALIIGWLLLSQPPLCLWMWTSFTL